MSVELFKVKKYSKTRKFLEFFKLTAKPKVMQSLKRSWKKSWKVVEIEELKRVRTLEIETLNLKMFSAREKVTFSSLELC